MNLKRYWFRFDIRYELPVGSKIGVGVTAYNLDDALSIVANKMFNEKELPPIEEQIENVDLRTLDSNHILPNMGIPNVRGIWFPLGY